MDVGRRILDHPEGIESFSPVLEQRAYSGKSIRKISSTRKGLNHLREERRGNPVGVEFVLGRLPRVALMAGPARTNPGLIDGIPVGFS
jgi:hypothetical protein